MSDKWAAVVELWPYSAVDQGLAGPRTVRVVVGGDDHHEASRALDLFLLGVKTNPSVWQTHVVSIARTTSPKDVIGEMLPYGCMAPDPGNLKEAVRKTFEALRCEVRKP